MKDLSVSIFYRRYHDFQVRERRRISQGRNLCLLLSTHIISSDWAEVTTCLLTLPARMCAPDLQRRSERERARGKEKNEYSAHSVVFRSLFVHKVI